MNKDILETTVRQAVLSGQSDMIRALLLNDCQLSLLTMIDNVGEMTASRLSFIDDVTIQNASSKLTRLYRSGYLCRKSRSSESGGIEFVYTIKGWEHKPC